MRFLVKLVFSLGVTLLVGAGYMSSDRGAPRSAGAAFAKFVSERGAGTPLVAYLPQPQLGWTAEPWTPEIRHLMNMERVPSAGPGIEHEPEPQPRRGVVNLATLGGDTDDTVVYRRGGEIVVIEIRKRAGGLVGAVAEAIEAEGSKEYFARYGRTEFRENLGYFGEQVELKRSFTGIVADRVVISVKSRAREGSVKTLLGKIDYNGIIASLDIEEQETGPVVNKLPQISTGPSYQGSGLSEAEMVNAALEANWLMRLARLLGVEPDGKEKQKMPGRVVVNRGGREGCETNRGGCAMATMRR